MINSRAKGARGERAFRDVLREAGYLKARRGAQYSGHVEAPDVLCPELPDIHWEVKCVEAGNPYNWIEQALRDSRRIKYPIVAHKRNDKPWLGILYMRELLEIIRRSDLPIIGESVAIGSNGSSEANGVKPPE